MICPPPFAPFSAVMSHKAQKKILAPFCAGVFSHDDSSSKDYELIIGKQGHRLMGNVLHLYWLVDRQSGVIVDAKFQVFGHALLIAVAETCCELLISKVYTDSYKINLAAIEKHLRDHDHIPAFPEDYYPLLHFAIDAMDSAAEQCNRLEIPGVTAFQNSDFSTPEFLFDEEANPLSDEAWAELSPEQRLQNIRSIVETHIAPYLALDGGSISIESIHHNEITVAYSGNCSGCYSAIGSTLNSITQLIQKFVYPKISVKVREDSLLFPTKEDSSSL